MSAAWQNVFTYPLLRGPKRRRHSSRDEFLPPGRYICQEFEEGVGNSDVADRQGLEGFPWPTPILGSGCLAIASNRMLSAEVLIRGVQEHLAGATSFAHQDPSELVEEFIRSLYRDRVRSSAFGRDDGTPIDVAEEAARLTLLAARLTRFYYVVNADQLPAVSRWGSEPITYDPQDGRYGYYTVGLQDSLIEPILREIGGLRTVFRKLGSTAKDDGTARSPQNVHKMAGNVLREIQDEFCPGPEDAKSVSFDRVRQLTEIAWHLLTKDLGIYPGWSDLLLGMLLEQARPESSSLRLKRRPLPQQLNHLSDDIRAWFDAPSRTSFKESLEAGSKPSPRVEFFDALAALLATQAATAAAQAEIKAEAQVAGRPVDAVEFPPSSALVTSFDLELEMALWRADTPFSVVVPVHVQEHHGAKAALLWLLCDINPRDHEEDADYQLKLLRKGSHWEVLTNHSRSRLSRPTVVRLSGSPLMDLPPLAVLATQLGRMGLPASQCWHAVTVDEYTAVQRSTAELVAWQRRSSDSSDEQSYLPEQFTVGAQLIPRFWLALGAQISDPAIRFQLFTEIFKASMPRRDKPTMEWAKEADEAEPMASEPGAPRADLHEGWSEDATDDGSVTAATAVTAADAHDPAVDPEVDTDSFESPFRLGGLAVNHRIEDDDAGLLYWLEFTVVGDDCAEFTADLQHYREHIEQVHTPHSRPSDGHCPL